MSHCHDCGKDLSDGGGVRREVVVRRFVRWPIPIPWFVQTERVLLCHRCAKERGPEPESLTAGRLFYYAGLIALTTLLVIGAIWAFFLLLLWYSPR